MSFIYNEILNEVEIQKEIEEELDIEIEYNGENKNHPLVSLPHVILKEIVSKFDNTVIDGIIFSLVCKRLYHEREKYLFFNFDILLLRIDKTKSTNVKSYASSETIFKSKFKSYQNIINKSINSKRNATLLISSPKSTTNAFISERTLIDNKYLTLFDYFVNNKDVKTILSEKSIGKVILGNASQEMVDYVLNLLLDYESVTSLVIRSSKVSVDHDSFPSFSRHILNLELDDIGQSIPISYFPPFLERLSLGPAYPIISDPGELPTTIKYLKLGMKYNHPFASQQLPPNLEELHFSNNNYNHMIDNDMIPQSLHTITGVGSIGHLERNQSLRKLKLGSATSLSSITIPPTLQELSIPFYQENLTQKPLPQFIPPTLANLKLKVLPTEGYHIGSVAMPPLIQLMTGDCNLKSLKLKSVCPITLAADTFPHGLETLDIQNIILQSVLYKDVIKDSIKKLILPPQHEKSTPKFLAINKSIPNSVESLIISPVSHELLGYFPTTVKHISLPWNFAYQNRIEFIFPSLQSYSIESITCTTTHKRDYFQFRKLDNKHFILFYSTNGYLSFKQAGIARMKDLNRFYHA